MTMYQNFQYLKQQRKIYNFKHNFQKLKQDQETKFKKQEGK
jgi:hypothetical protein